MVRIVKTRPRAEEKSTGKASSYYLGFHPDARWREAFSMLDGASLEYVKQHLESFGGKVKLGYMDVLPKLCCEYSY